MISFYAIGTLKRVAVIMIAVVLFKVGGTSRAGLQASGMA